MSETCTWRQDEDCIWHGTCGITWEMGNEYGPKFNQMNYCPKCGLSLEVKRGNRSLAARMEAAHKATDNSKLVFGVVDQSRPVPAGSLVEWQGNQAIVLNDSGGIELTVNQGDEPVQWRWWLDGIEVTVLRRGPE